MASTGTLSTLSGAWLTTAQQNAVVGYPAAETYPGPVSEPHDPVATGEPLIRNDALTGQAEGPAFPAEGIPIHRTRGVGGPPGSGVATPSHATAPSYSRRGARTARNPNA